ncbi:MAG: hypothetical protein LKI24_08255 [Acidipropionibacterium sp.]|jgi:hypothetical protein|nr:hypothetical protein [Acidipropionibacterium sp.]
MSGGVSSGLTLITGIGLPIMVCLVVLGISGLVRAVTGRPPHPGAPACCHTTPTTPGSARLGGLADAAMGLGMAWMSAGLMSPLLPFMGHLTPDDSVHMTDRTSQTLDRAGSVSGMNTGRVLIRRRAA